MNNEGNRRVWGLDAFSKSTKAFETRRNTFSDLYKLITDIQRLNYSHGQKVRAMTLQYYQSLVDMEDIEQGVIKLSLISELFIPNIVEFLIKFSTFHVNCDFSNLAQFCNEIIDRESRRSKEKEYLKFISNISNVKQLNDLKKCIKKNHEVVTSLTSDVTKIKRERADKELKRAIKKYNTLVKPTSEEYCDYIGVMKAYHSEIIEVGKLQLVELANGLLTGLTPSMNSLSDILNLLDVENDQYLNKFYSGSSRTIPNTSFDLNPANVEEFLSQMEFIPDGGDDDENVPVEENHPPEFHEGLPGSELNFGGQYSPANYGVQSNYFNAEGTVDSGNDEDHAPPAYEHVANIIAAESSARVSQAGSVTNMSIRNNGRGSQPARHSTPDNLIANASMNMNTNTNNNTSANVSALPALVSESLIDFDDLNFTYDLQNTERTALPPQPLQSQPNRNADANFSNDLMDIFDPKRKHTIVEYSTTHMSLPTNSVPRNAQSNSELTQRDMIYADLTNDIAQLQQQPPLQPAPPQTAEQQTTDKIYENIYSFLKLFGDQTNTQNSNNSNNNNNNTNNNTNRSEPVYENLKLNFEPPTVINYSFALTETVDARISLNSKHTNSFLISGSLMTAMTQEDAKTLQGKVNGFHAEFNNTDVMIKDFLEKSKRQFEIHLQPGICSYNLDMSNESCLRVNNGEMVRAMEKGGVKNGYVNCELARYTFINSSIKKSVVPLFCSMSVTHERAEKLVKVDFSLHYNEELSRRLGGNIEISGQVTIFISINNRRFVGMLTDKNAAKWTNENRFLVFNIDKQRYGGLNNANCLLFTKKIEIRDLTRVAYEGPLLEEDMHKASLTFELENTLFYNEVDIAGLSHPEANKIAMVKRRIKSGRYIFEK